MEGNNLNTPDTNFGQKPIRTYEGDIAEAIEHKKTSQVSINLAEVERQRAQGIQASDANGALSTSGSFGKNILKILISLLLLGGGAIGLYYLYLQSPLAAKPILTQQTITYPAIITPDSQKTIDIGGKNSSQLIDQIKSQVGSELSTGKILELILYEQQTAQDVTTTARITGPQFISRIGLTPPDVLTRSLTDSWMLGAYKGSETTPFIILTTNFFQNAFSGMLKWEPTMADNLSKIFTFQTQNPQSSATTSPPAAFFGIRGSFADKVIKNKDVREFRDQDGNILFLYAFMDNSTLVITRGEDTLAEIITRFEKRAYVR